MTVVRNKIFSKRRGHVFPMGPSAPSPGLDGKVVDRVTEEERVKHSLNALRVEDAGRDQSFVRSEQTLLRFPAQFAPMELCTFLVPSGRVLVVTNLQFFLSEPFLYVNQQIGWRLAINSEQINNHSSVNMANDHFLYAPLPMTPGDDSSIDPVVVPQNARVSVEVIQNPWPPPITPPVTFLDSVWATATIRGRLRKPAGGNLA